MEKETYNHETVMTSGTYAGMKLKDIPARHFLFKLDIFGIEDGPLKDYIKENEEMLRERVLLESLTKPSK